MVAKWLGNGLQNRHTSVRIRSAPPARRCGPRGCHADESDPRLDKISRLTIKLLSLGEEGCVQEQKRELVATLDPRTSATPRSRSGDKWASAKLMLPHAHNAISET